LSVPAGYLLDTNFISETRKIRTNAGVIETTFADRVLAVDAAAARLWASYLPVGACQSSIR
jgi:hypothetical protein